jgi:hypothetical protein
VAGLEKPRDLLSLWRERPLLLAALFALIPVLVTLLGMAFRLTPEVFIQLVMRPRSITGVENNPWPLIFRSLLGSTALLGLLFWLTGSISQSALLRSQGMRLKQVIVAFFAFLTACTMWMGIILGDTAWHVALQGMPAANAPSALETGIDVYLVSAVATALILYLFLRPRKY